MAVNDYLPVIQEFENALDTGHPEKSGALEITLLGYGEISTVFGIKFEDGSRWACKRMPIFTSGEQASGYVDLYREYNESLLKAGLHVPAFDGLTVRGHNGIYVNYLMQEQLDPGTVCSSFIKGLPRSEQVLMLERIVMEMSRIWAFNRGDSGILLGLDGQISNWAFRGGDTENGEILFIDTSTPFIRKNGAEQIDGRLLLRSAPEFLQPILAKLFLEDVIGRYYSFRSVIIDMIANLYKEQLSEIIDDALAAVNGLLGKELSGFGIELIAKDEVVKYYKEDKFIWNLYMSVRKMDRFIKTKILGRRYEFILPGPIKR